MTRRQILFERPGTDRRSDNHGADDLDEQQPVSAG